MGINKKSSKNHIDLRFHVHNDIDILKNIPTCLKIDAEVFIMQESRVVFLGKTEQAEAWMKVNNNKFIDQLPYIK